MVGLEKTDGVTLSPEVIKKIDALSIYSEVEEKFRKSLESVIFAIYTRVSTVSQEQKISYAIQKENLEGISDLHPDWQDSGVRYEDIGKSATSTAKRKAFNKMIIESQTSIWNVLVVRDVSRFARSFDDFMDFIKTLHNNGKAVYFVDYNAFSTDRHAQKMLRLLAEQAEEESAYKRKATLSGHKARREFGFVFGSNNRYGWDLLKTPKGRSNKLVANDYESRVVNMIFDWYIGDEKTEGIGYRAIADRLNDENFDKAPYMYKGELHSYIGRISKSKNTGWKASTVENIITNKCYCGYVRYNTSHKSELNTSRKKNRNREEYIYAPTPDVDQIIDEDKFLRAEKIRQERSTISYIPLYNKDGTVIRDDEGSIIYEVEAKTKDGEITLKKKIHGRKVVHNIYTKKLQCECGCTFKHHSMLRPNKKVLVEKYDETTGKYNMVPFQPDGFTCYRYDGSNSGEYENKKCNVKPFLKYVLDFSAYKVFDEIWHERRGAIELACKMIADAKEQLNNQVPKVDTSELEKNIEYKTMEVERAYKIMLQYDESLHQEIYLDAKERYEKAIEEKMALKSALAIELQKKNTYVSFDKNKALDAIAKQLDSTIVYEKNAAGYEEVAPEMISEFVDRILVKSDRQFDWYIKPAGGCVNPQNINKFDEDYKLRYTLNKEAILFESIDITFDELNAFYKKYFYNSLSRQRNENGELVGKDIKINIYLEL